MRRCSRCRTAEAILGQKWCRQCFNEYARAHLVPYSKLTERQKVMARCRSNTYQLVKRGRLVRLPCEVCGAGLVHAHHDDHAKPGEVTWLCPKHLRRRRTVAPASDSMTLGDVLVKHLSPAG